MRTVESAALDAVFDFDTLQAILREHPVRLAVLFGSHATDMVHTTTDIDLAVEFDEHRPSDPNYNNLFLGLSADLSDAFGTDDIDLVDLHTVSPALAAASFAKGVLIIGTVEHAAELRSQLTARESDQQSPRERLGAVLARIDDHFADNDAEVPATGETDDD
jgi:Nucleotidyltransferase domain.